MTATSYRPQAGAQERFASTPADIAIYGGAAGGGKSWALLFEALRYVHVPNYGAVIFRRTSPQIRNQGGLWDESQSMFLARGGAPKESVLEWDFPKGTKIKFSHLEHEKNKLDWQGSQIPLIGFDELTHFTESQFFYMLSRNRSTCGVKPYVRATTNPDSQSWVRRLIDWWIDSKTGLAIPERSGVIRWFIRLGDELFFSDNPQELAGKCDEEIQPKSLTFIAASVHDNKKLLEKDPNYIANLMALPRVEREQLLGGNWNVKRDGGKIIKGEWFRRYEVLPPLRKIIITADTANKTKTANDYSVFTCAALGEDGNVYLIDLKRGKWESPDLIMTARDFWNKHKRREGAALGASEFYIEDKQSGTSLVQHLQRELGQIIKPVQRNTDKYTRVNGVVPSISGGQAYLPKHAGWVSDFIAECEDFTDNDSHAFDDQLDTLCDALEIFLYTTVEAAGATAPAANQAKRQRVRA